ncbi:hypothetical protein [Chryseobacterium sediminis]|uniref:Uncharacterized protein n=1 Tax=Chryseobacterium sediminis TaxID=1679494 RepID=A0A5B2U8P3_9FLAO|nr:hypothetical protein [Chryseobacterium sediminis]KAA2223011.1 hypothetical protein FW780_02065 [Chryseobacterium sediminis]
MKNSKYIKVSVLERLPEKKDYYHTDKGQLTFLPFAGWYRGCMKVSDPYYWLQEVPDYEDEVKQMLEDNIEKAKQNIIFCTEKNMMSTVHSWEGRLMAYRECLELLTKIKES